MQINVKHSLGIIACLLLASWVAHAEGDLKLPSLFTDHMILQRDKPVPVWGWTKPGEEVTVEFAPSAGSGQAGQKKTAKADAGGKWMVKLDPMSASAVPGKLKISCSLNPDPSTGGVSAKVEPLILSDILVGDVWLCSGQSNMSMGVRESLNADQEIASAQFPQIRLFSVGANPTLEETMDVKGTWAECSPQSVGGFSGVAYFFGRELHRELKIPIGLLQSSVGGTLAEAWMPLEALKTVPALAERAEKEIAQIKSQPEDSKNFPVVRLAWEQKYGVVPPPVSEAARDWAAPVLDTSDWKTVTLPAQWGQLGAKSGGVFWLRKEVFMPESAAGKPTRVSPNWVNEQYDTVYYNGVEVGRVKDQAPEFYNIQRGYRVPGELVKAGRNVVAVRLVAATPHAGMWVTANPLNLPFTDPAASDNTWLMKTESTFPPLTEEALKERPKPNTLAFRNVSSALYNGMIAPLIPFALKGAIWYQGESNIPRHTEYRDTLSLLITTWRKQWGTGEFPFMIQQLVNNDPASDDANARSSWSLLREAQVQVADTVPNCGLAVGIELGSAFTIHPPNKQEVGKRLALVALEKTYGQKIESSGPRYETMKIENNSIRVRFTHAKGLQAKGGPLKTFALASADGKFVWADAKIEGSTVVVSSPNVLQPVAVRYAWADNPEGCNLFNGEGLPAFPFEAKHEKKN